MVICLWMTSGVNSGCMALSDKQIRFAREYCVDFNATKAYIRAGYSENGAGESAHKLLNNAQIQEYVEEQKRQLAALAEATGSLVLREWLDVATADPRELIHTRVGCCRFCYGIDHKYQWTEGGYSSALDRAIEADKRPPDIGGGLGYNGHREPFAECPECMGAGIYRTWIADARNYSRKAARLFAGVKQTKDGIEIKMRDQDAAWAKIADYLGMSNKAQLTGPGGGPLLHAVATLADMSDEQLLALAARNTVNLGVLPGVSQGTDSTKLIEAST
jgi:phage terminase small subunit